MQSVQLLDTPEYTGHGSGGSNYAEIGYLLSFREFQLLSGLTKITNTLCGFERAELKGKV